MADLETLLADTRYFADQGSDPSAPSAGEPVLYTKSGELYLRNNSLVRGPMLDETAHDALDHTGLTGVGGGGGGGTVSFLGYNTIGASWVSMTAQRVYMKPFTLSEAAIVLAIQAHIRLNSGSQADEFWTALYTDSGGDPALLISQTSPVVNSYILDSINGTGGESVGRWLSGSHNYPLPAGDYWAAVRGPGTTQDLAYDGSGSDRYYTSGGAFFTDYGFYSPTTTTDKFSIRVPVLPVTIS